MKKNIFLSIKKSILLIFLFLLSNTRQIVAQSSNICGTNTASAFTYTLGNCSAVSIQLDAKIISSNPNVNYYWHVGTNPIGFATNPVVGSGTSICVPVAASNTTYYIALYVEDNILGNSVSNCSYYIPFIPFTPIQYLKGVSPSTAITKGINTDSPVGTIKGINSVSLTGAATYSIPVAVPSGTLSIEPSLNFVYSSQGENSVMGMGWNLGVGSNIMLVPKDFYHDGYCSAAKSIGSDAFAIDGNRLILETGTYGADGSTYRTKNETFVRITKNYKVNVYDNFTVETKNGLKIEYGKSSNSALGGANRSNVLWLINRVEDQYGNYMEYKYHKASYGFALHEILYTGNEKAGIVPYNKIIFDYSVREDQNISYIVGSKSPLISNCLLTNVTILAEGELFREYKFKYVFDGIHSYLREMSVNDGNGKQLNPTVFQYGTVDAEFKADLITGYSAQKPFMAAGDFNGDGINDLVEYSLNSTTQTYTSFKAILGTKAGSVFSPKPSTAINYKEPVYKKGNGLVSQINFLAQDFDGDGYDDIPFANFQEDELTKKFSGARFLKSIDVHHSKGDGTFNPAPVSYNTIGKYKYAFGNNRYIISGDFDGDSQADYITILSDEIEPRIFANFPANNSLNNSVTFNYANNHYTPVINNYPYPAAYLATAPILKSINFDGDAKNELLSLEYGKENKDGTGFNYIKVYELENTPNGYVLNLLLSKQIPNTENDIQFGDFNGDGKTDLLTVSQYQKTQYAKDFHQYLSTGSDFVNMGIVVGAVEAIDIADLNGDGLADITYNTWKDFGTGNYDYEYYVRYSTGTNFTPVKKYTFSIPTNKIKGLYRDAVGDFNGSGKTSLIERSSLIISFFKNSTNHLLAKVVDGYNRTIDFSYENATSNTIYTRGNLKSYPLNSIQTPMYMVSQMSAPDGVGGITSTQYKYEDMKIHRKGLGFLGCGSVTVTNASQGTESYSRFKILQNTQNNKTGYSTVPEYSSEKKGGTLVSETTQDFILDPLSNGRWWLKNKSTTSVNKITGATTISTPIYDTYGNVTEENTDILNVQKSTVSHIFEQHGSWIPSSPVSTTISISRTGSPSYSKTTLRKFDDQGLLREERDFANTPNEILSEPTYYSNGMPHFNKVSAPKSLLKVYEKETELRYDPNFRFVQEKYNSLKQLVAKITYNKKWGKPLSETDIDGNSVGYQYDGLGRLILTISPLGHSITTDYDWNIKSGNSLFTIYTRHPCKPDTKEYFDILERSYAVETETFASGILRSSQEYDNQGRVTSSVSTTGVTTTNKYDALDRLEISTNPIGPTTYAYLCGGGNTKVTVIPPSGHEIISTSDATGKVIKKEDNGGVLEYKYDSQGNNILVKLAGKPVGISIFDIAGNRTSFEEPNAGITTYVYDAYGQLRKQTDSKGNLTVYSYDVLGRTTTRDGKEGVTEYLYKTTQGGLNKIEDVIGFNGINQNYTYDNFGRVLSVTDNGFTHGYGYDPCGNTDKEVYPTGFELSRKYDTNSFLLTVQDAKGRAFFTGKSMDNLGNYSSYTLGNNITSDITYDAFGFPVTFFAGGAQRLRFDFDLQTGNLMGRYDSRSGLDETFTYDDLDRLRTSSKNNLSINYSSNGNIENKTDAGAQDYIYDKTRINAVTKIPAANDYRNHTQSVTYTPFHQPDEIGEHLHRSDGPPCETNLFLTFTYGADYERRVMELRCESQLNVGGTVTQLVHDRRYYNGNYEEDHVAPT